MSPDAWSVLAAAQGGQSELTGLAGLITDIIAALGPIGVGVLVALETLFPPIPSELILPLSGYLASRGRMSLAAVVVGATLGSLVGALALYWAGAALGQKRLRRLAERTPLVEVEDLERAEGWFDRHGGLAVLIGRVVRSCAAWCRCRRGWIGAGGGGTDAAVAVRHLHDRRQRRLQPGADRAGLCAWLPLADGRAVLQLPQLRDLRRHPGGSRAVRAQAGPPPASQLTSPAAGHATRGGRLQERVL
jgi:membrane protein YqaA with SNARE-associated domain